MFGFFIGENLIGQAENATAATAEGLYEIVTKNSFAATVQHAKLVLVLDKSVTSLIDDEEHDLEGEIEQLIELNSFCTTIMIVDARLNTGTGDNLIELSGPIQDSMNLVGNADGRLEEENSFCTILLAAKLDIRTTFTMTQAMVLTKSEDSQLMHEDLTG